MGVCNLWSVAEPSENTVREKRERSLINRYMYVQYIRLLYNREVNKRMGEYANEKS